MNTTRVLVVDDEPFICRSLSFVLRKEKFEVFEARNGEEALEAVRAHRPHLVFLDVMMPKINGFEVTARIKADPELKDTKIILLTAKGQDCDRVTGEGAGADRYLTKPFSPSKILHEVRDILGLPAS